MTSSLNLVEIRNLSMICRQGSETIAQLCKSSPFRHSNSFSPPTSIDFVGAASLPMFEGREEHHKRDVTQTLARNERGQKRSRGGCVRFDPSISTKDELSYQCKGRKRLKRKNFDSSDSVSWWTKEELGEIQKSCVDAVNSYEFGLPLVSSSSRLPIEEHHFSSLERYSIKNRKRRKIARLQMRETIRAVEEFERATKIKTPPEMLAQLLQKHSVYTAEEAKIRALRTAKSCAILNSSSGTAKRTSKFIYTTT